MMKTILVGLGDTQFSASATDHAVDLAVTHGARLCAVTLFNPESLGGEAVPIGAGDSARELREHRIGQMQETLDQAGVYFEKAAKKAKLEYEIVLETGNSFQQLISCSRYYDLIICGLRSLFSGKDEAPPHELILLVEEGVRPLIAVGETYHPIERVLIAYSGSTESAKTMRRFVQLRLWPDATMRIVTFERDQEKGQTRLDDAARYCQIHGFSPEIEVVSQAPRDALLSYAAGWNADLIVLGNSAKGLLLRRIFGETALHVVANSDRPLFLCQ
jgi:nucleotide-binding universal stress UspA family protein